MDVTFFESQSYFLFRPVSQSSLQESLGVKRVLLLLLFLTQSRHQQYLLLLLLKLELAMAIVSSSFS
ncbi:hypothetical protein CsSME_00038486 [Camellia sinensis var. sinensis]